MGNIRAAGKLCIKHTATKPATYADLPSLLLCLHPGQVACLCERLKTAPHSLSIHIAKEATRHGVLPAGIARVLLLGPAQALCSMHPAQGRRATCTGYTNTLHYKALQTHYSPFSWYASPVSSAQANDYSLLPLCSLTGFLRPAHGTPV